MAPELTATPAELQLARECADFFAARLKGPEEARAAVLGALARSEPYPLVQRALSRASREGLSRRQAYRVGLIAEVLRTAMVVAEEAYAGEFLPSRLARARRILVADTLLTFLYELTADLSDDVGSRVRALLSGLLGNGGFLGALAERGPAASGDALVEEFLEGVLEGGRAVDEPA
jgi:hypothetical protein